MLPVVLGQLSFVHGADDACPRAEVVEGRVRAILGSAPAALSERALYGRATCRLRSGDDAGGQVDLEAYLTRFPNGRFAGQVRQRLAR